MYTIRVLAFKTKTKPNREVSAPICSKDTIRFTTKSTRHSMLPIARSLNAFACSVRTVPTTEGGRAEDDDDLSLAEAGAAYHVNVTSGVSELELQSAWINE